MSQRGEAGGPDGGNYDDVDADEVGGDEEDDEAVRSSLSMGPSLQFLLGLTERTIYASHQIPGSKPEGVTTAPRAKRPLADSDKGGKDAPIDVDDFEGVQQGGVIEIGSDDEEEGDDEEEVAGEPEAKRVKVA